MFAVPAIRFGREACGDVSHTTHPPSTTVNTFRASALPEPGERGYVVALLFCASTHETYINFGALPNDSS